MAVRTLRFVLGGVAGFLVWWYVTPAYDAALAFGAQAMVRADGRLGAPNLVARDRVVDVRPSRRIAPEAVIPADQLTYNIVLLVALFSMQRGFLRDRNVVALAVALLLLIVTHVIALAVSIESTYAIRMSKWSEDHYSLMEQRVWVSIEFLYRIVGMFAIVFVCWWRTLDRNRPVGNRAGFPM